MCERRSRVQSALALLRGHLQHLGDRRKRCATLEDGIGCDRDCVLARLVECNPADSLSTVRGANLSRQPLCSVQCVLPQSLYPIRFLLIALIFQPPSIHLSRR
jgi:hypothetical protein